MQSLLNANLSVLGRKWKAYKQASVALICCVDDITVGNGSVGGASFNSSTVFIQFHFVSLSLCCFWFITKTLHPKPAPSVTKEDVL